MTKDTVVGFRGPRGFSPDPLTDLLREGARNLIAQAVEAELATFLDAHATETDAIGHRRLVLVLSRICAAPSARLGHLAFEGQGAFASQC